jgi:hypothetical protein
MSVGAFLTHAWSNNSYDNYQDCNSHMISVRNYQCASVGVRRIVTGHMGMVLETEGDG